MKQNLLLLLYICTLSALRAQIIPMANGTGQTIDCAAADTGGRVFTFKYTYADSLIGQRWNPQTQNWTLLPRIDKRFSPFNLQPDCQVLSNNQLIVGGVYDTSKFAVYAVNGNTWSRLGVFVDPGLSGFRTEQLRLYKYMGKVYMVTTIDSIIGYPKSRVYEVNSNGLVSLNFQVNSPEYHLALKGDTLAISANNSIYYYSAGSWKQYYRGPYKSSNTIRGMTGYGTYLYVTEGQSTISKIYQGSKIDSVQTAFDRPELTSIGNRIMISERAGDRTGSMIYSFTNLKLIHSNARLGLADSIPTRFIISKNKVYVYNKERDIIFNKVNCHGIAELDMTQIFPQITDTIIIRTFLDHNRNNKLDAGDTPFKLYVPSIYGEAAVLTDATSGVAVYYPLTNEDICFRPVDGISTDSCYSLQYSAAICSRAYNSIRNRDTIDFAYQARSNGYKNIKIRSFNSGRQRIDTEFNSDFIVYREDCNNSSIANIKFYIDIAAGTELISSSPAYISRTGNRLYYVLSLPNAGASNVRLTMKYPFADFKLNDRVCHKAFISSISGEDTMGNRDSIVHRATYGYDPNAKYSIPEGKVYSGLKKIRYHIDFQNEGNDYAYRVKVVDTLNIKIPVYEFRMHAASHDYKVSANGNVLTWTFEDIMLAPKSLSEEGSKGYLEFDASIASDIRVGDSIFNNAMIYFDLNEPIRTNNATVIRANKDNSIEEFSKGGIRIYPNPGSTLIYIEGEELSYTVYNSIGQYMGEWAVRGGRAEIETSTWSRGFYIIRGKGGVSGKVVLE